MFKNIKLNKTDFMNVTPPEQRKVKASTGISMQSVLTNALNNRAPQNNGASIQQPAQSEGFGRTI